MFGCCGNRDNNKIETPTTQPQQGGASVGVGIVFQPDQAGALHVRSLAVGGPADKSGQVQIEDELHEIDGENVYCKSVGGLAPLILGPPGTTVRLGLRRHGVQELVHVTLQRGWTMDKQAKAEDFEGTHRLPTNAKLSYFGAPQRTTA